MLLIKASTVGSGALLDGGWGAPVYLSDAPLMNAMGMRARDNSLGSKARLPKHSLQHGSQLERTTLIARTQLKETMAVERAILPRRTRLA